MKIAPGLGKPTALPFLCLPFFVGIFGSSAPLSPFLFTNELSYIYSSDFREYLLCPQQPLLIPDCSQSVAAERERAFQGKRSAWPPASHCPHSFTPEQHFCVLYLFFLMPAWEESYVKLTIWEKQK